jgi:hypothetical protein
MLGLAPCQQPESDAEDDELEESLEQEETLVGVAGDALPPLARCVTAARFMPLWSVRAGRRSGR